MRLVSVLRSHLPNGHFHMRKGTALCRSCHQVKKRFGASVPVRVDGVKDQRHARALVRHGHPCNTLCFTSGVCSPSVYAKTHTPSLANNIYTCLLTKKGWITTLTASTTGGSPSQCCYACTGYALAGGNGCLGFYYDQTRHSRAAICTTKALRPRWEGTTTMCATFGATIRRHRRRPRQARRRVLHRRVRHRVLHRVRRLQVRRHRHLHQARLRRLRQVHRRRARHPANAGLLYGLVPFACIFAILFSLRPRFDFYSGFGGGVVWLMTFVLWGLYGVVALGALTFEWPVFGMDAAVRVLRQSTSYNLLDVLSKNGVGIFISIISSGHNMSSTCAFIPPSSPLVPPSPPPAAA